MKLFDISATNGVSLGWNYLFDQPMVDVAVFGDAGSIEITLTNLYYSLKYMFIYTHITGTKHDFTLEWCNLVNDQVHKIAYWDISSWGLSFARLNFLDVIR